MLIFSGLNITHDQLFFISFAQVLRSFNYEPLTNNKTLE